MSFGGRISIIQQVPVKALSLLFLLLIFPHLSSAGQVNMKLFCWSVAILFHSLSFALPQNDTLGIANGYLNFETESFTLQLVKDSQTLASLVPKNLPNFDFQFSKALLALRASNGQHQTGDLIIRYRAVGDSAWTTQDTAASRKPVKALKHNEHDVLASSNLAPTLNNSLIEVVRTWGEVDGDLYLAFKLFNVHNAVLEIGGLGAPFTSDSAFTNRTAIDINENCSLIDPYIGLNAGYVQYTRINGLGPAVVVTPLNNDTSFEGWGFLNETDAGIQDLEYTTNDWQLTYPEYDALEYSTGSFEGYFQWMTRTLAYVETEWAGAEPWNIPTSQVLKPGECLEIGFRFTMVDEIVNIVDTVKQLGLPIAKGVPGYIIPSDLEAKLSIESSSPISNFAIDPADALSIEFVGSSMIALTPNDGTWGRVRLTITYEDDKVQTIQYYITKSAPEAVSDLGGFLEEHQWWDVGYDRFNRRPSFMCVDHSDGSLITQDFEARVWFSGECHEAGASWYTMALKQSAQPVDSQVTKMESFVHEVLWKTIQLPNYSVRQSIFWYEPNITDFSFDPEYPWKLQTDTMYTDSWNAATANVTSRAYGYTYPATAYWSLYRVGRTFPDMLKKASWEWYLTQAYKTAVYCFGEVNGTHPQPLWYDGLMGETVYGELLKDLYREGWNSAAKEVESVMLARVQRWNVTEIPFGSELGWDCTGEEGVFYWSAYFGIDATVNKTIQTIFGYMPAISHWGYNGNARRYWDFTDGGKLTRIERQIHHYGSGLNALPLLEFYRTYPSLATPYILRLGYGGHFAPLSNIHQDGYAACAFHSWSDTLRWDNYTGDYGPGFAGLILGAASYVAEDPDFGLVAYGGELATTGDGYVVQPRDSLRRRMYIATLQLFIEVDAGAIESATVDNDSVTLQLASQAVPDSPPAPQAILWLDQSLYVNTSNTGWTVEGAYRQERAGSVIPLGRGSVAVKILRK